MVLFQTDKPMLPSMNDELPKVSKRLIALMYKKEKIDEAKTEVMKEDWLKNKNSQMKEFLIDIGAALKTIYPKPQWPLKRNENSEESANCLLSICC